MSGICSKHQGHDGGCPTCNPNRYKSVDEMVKKVSGWKFKIRWLFNKYMNGIKCSIGIHDYVRIPGHYPYECCSWCNKERRFK